MLTQIKLLVNKFTKFAKPAERAVRTGPQKLMTDSIVCPYCASKNIVKRGWRKKKLEYVQLLQCSDCHKTFTPHSVKGKHYPLSVIFDSLSIYNLGYSLEQTCRIINSRMAERSNGSKNHATIQPFNHLTINPSTLSNWISENIELCKFSRMREFAMKKYSPKDMVIHATLAHQQLYHYRFHRGKCDLMIREEYQHRKFQPLADFLEMVPVECPHQYFSTGLRASEAPLAFSKKQMIVRAKSNFANKLCTFVLQSVKERKDRHEALEKFMLANDSVTVATEIPVYITRDDIEHMKTQLGFQIYTKKIDLINLIPNSPKQIPSTKNQIGKLGIGDSLDQLEQLEIRNSDLPKLITGHIDILQIRNGQIHILDYKPNAEKERPIEQLTLYAMALSRLTGLRLFEFKCAWFDEKDYFEFYPLHVLHKPKKGSRRRKIATGEGIYKINQDREKIFTVRPIINY